MRKIFFAASLISLLVTRVSSFTFSTRSMRRRGRFFRGVLEKYGLRPQLACPYYPHHTSLLRPTITLPGLHMPIYMLGPNDTLSPRWYLFSPSPPLISPSPPVSCSALSTQHSKKTTRSFNFFPVSWSCLFFPRAGSSLPSRPLQHPLSPRAILPSSLRPRFMVCLMPLRQAVFSSLTPVR